MFRNARIEFFVVYQLPADAITQAVASVQSLLDAGVLMTLPVHEYALEDVAQAHDDVQGGLVGRALIAVE
jgi:NADPH2:quinone reductase